MALLAMTIKTFPTDQFNAEHPPDAPGREFDKHSRIWRVYRDERSAFDLDRVDGWNKLFDILLTFAGLFIAALTVFLVDSYKSLQEDSTDYIAELLYNVTATAPVVQVIGSVTRPRSDTSHPSPSRLVRWTNAVWFSSLLITLAVALYCILAKQWIREYERVVRSGATTSYEWMKRQTLAWESMKRWGVPFLISLLPTLLHAALFLFLLGLCLFLAEINTGITKLVAAAGGAILCIYLIQNLVPLFVESCAWRTSLTRRARAHLRPTPGTTFLERTVLAFTRVGPKVDGANCEGYAIRWLILSRGSNAAAVAIQAMAAAVGPSAMYNYGFSGEPLPTEAGRAYWQLGRDVADAATSATGAWPWSAGLIAGWVGFTREEPPSAAGATRDETHDSLAGYTAGQAARLALDREVRSADGGSLRNAPPGNSRLTAAQAAGFAGFQVGAAAASARIRSTGATTPVAAAVGAAGPRTLAVSQKYSDAYMAGYSGANASILTDEVLQYLREHKPDDLKERLESRREEIIAYAYSAHQPAKDELEYCERALQALRIIQPAYMGP